MPGSEGLQMVECSGSYIPGPSRLQQPRAVHQEVQGLAIVPATWSGHLQRPGTAAQGGVVRHGEIQAEQGHDGSDQALGLAQRQAEHCPQRQRRRDG